MDYLEITETINPADLNGVHELQVQEVQTPFKIKRLLLTALMDYMVSDLSAAFAAHILNQTRTHENIETDIASHHTGISELWEWASYHSAQYGNGKHIPTSGLSHTALTDKGTTTHAQLDTHVSDTLKHWAVLSWTNATYLNSWTTVAGFGSLAYAIDNQGYVHLRGVCMPGSNNLLATLPVGFRPTYKLLFPALYPVNSIYATVDTSGNISTNNYAGTGWLSFDSVKPFLAA